MGAAAAMAGQNLGAGHPERSVKAVHIAARFGLMIAATIGLIFLLGADQLLGFFGLKDPTVLMLGRQLLRYLSVSGLFITVALDLHGRICRARATRAARSSSRSSRRSRCRSGLCTYLEATGRLEASWIWTAILLGHCTARLLSTWVFAGPLADNLGRRPRTGA